MEYVSGNIFIREMRFPYSGYQVDGHAHDFDHTTYIATGRVRIERLAEDGTVERSVEKSAAHGFNWILIRAGVRHRLTAIGGPALGHCIYAHRTPQGEVVQEFNGWLEAHG